MTDWQLLQQFLLDGSQDAFTQLVDRHGDMVYSTARRLVRDDHLADDVTQAAFLLLALRGRSLSQKVVLAGWLYEAARLSASTALRSRRRRIQHESKAGIESSRMRESQQLDESNGPDPSTLWAELESRIDTAMRRLSRNHRDAVVLRYLEGRTFAESATILGISEDAAKMRVQRALRKLQQALAPHINSTSTLSTAMASPLVIATAPASLLQTLRTAATSLTAAKTTGLSFSIAKGTNAMMTWIKIKLVAAACISVMALGASAVVVAQQLEKHEASPPVIAVAAAPAIPAVVPAPIVNPPMGDGIPALSAAKPVTLHVKDATPPQAFQALAEASGVSIKIWPDTAWDPRFRNRNNPVPKITMDRDAQPFFAVFHDLCSAAGAMPNFNMDPNSNAISVMENSGSNQNNAPSFIAPAYIVTLNAISRQYSVQYSRDATIHDYRGIDLTLAIDQRVTILKTSRNVWIDKFVDENGVALQAQPNPTEDGYEFGFVRHAIDLIVPLNYDWKKSKKIQQLSGHARTLVGENIQTLEIPDLLHAQGAEKSLAGARVVVNNATNTGGQLNLKLTIYREPNISDDRWEELVQEAQDQRIDCLDSNGRKICSLGGGRFNDQINVDVVAGYQHVAGPIKLSWPIATSSETVDLPFEFHDLPLP